MRFLADENFNGRILRGLRRENAGFDVVRVQDTEIYMSDDRTVLAWASENGFVLLTHDVNTIPKYAYERVNAQLPMAGVVAIHSEESIADVIEDLLIIFAASTSVDFQDQVVYLPFD